MTIYEQLQSCPCDKKQVNTNDIDELINLVSVATCWTQSPCETFLMGARKEIIDLPSCLDDCSVFTFDPFYHPLLKDDDGHLITEDEQGNKLVKFYLVEQTGIEEEVTEITDYRYSEVDDVFRLNLPIPECGCTCNPCCDCPTEYRLIAEYMAGYELIPDCLIPLFCEALQYIIEKNNCDCEDCQDCDHKYDDERIEVTVPNAASLTVRLKAYFMEVLTKQYARQLGLISLCNKRSGFWGVIA